MSTSRGRGCKRSLRKPCCEAKVRLGIICGLTTFQYFYPSTAALNQQTKPSFSNPQNPYVVDNEPYINPFTGLPVIPETGYEAGPSNRPPAPLREPPRPPSLQPTVPTRTRSMPVEPTREPPRPPSLPSHPLSSPLESSFKAPIRPPKPSHLRAPPIVPPQPTSIRSATLPPQIPAPSPPPLWAPEAQQSQQRLIAPETPPEYGLTRMSSITEKQVVTE